MPFRHRLSQIKRIDRGVPSAVTDFFLVPYPFLTLYGIHAVWLLSSMRHICLVASVTAVLLWLYRDQNTNFPLLRLTVNMLAWFKCHVCPDPGDRLLQSADGEASISNSYLCFTPELVVILYEQKIPKVIDKSNKRILRGPHTSLTTLPKPACTRHEYSSIRPSCKVNCVLCYV